MAATTALLPHVDELVMEYLLFRGFTRSFQVLATERKRDRAKAFDVEQIIAQLLGFVQTFQIEPILDMWKFLEARFFSRLDASYIAVSGRNDHKMNALCDADQSSCLICRRSANWRPRGFAYKLNAGSSSSWHRWFILPYVQNPENDPYFRQFFDKQWLESFVTSFRNFLSLIFRNVPLPKLLALQVSRLEEPSLQLRLKTIQSECNRLRLLNTQASERIRKLEDAGCKAYHLVETMVHHAFTEHFAETNASRPHGAEQASGSSPVLQVLQSLSLQLRQLQSVFGQDSRNGQLYKNAEPPSALPDPLEVKLAGAVTAPGDSKRGDATASASASGVLSSSPSSASLQSAGSASSPTGESAQNLSPTLIEEKDLDSQEHASDEFVCRYAQSGKRIAVGHRNQLLIQVFTVNNDGTTDTDEEIRTESAVINVDWIAQTECLVYALQDGSVHVWDTLTKTRTFIISYNADERRPSHLACAASTAVGAVALMSESGSQENSRVQFLAFEDHGMRVLSSVDLTEPAAVAELHWASDGSILVVAHTNGRISILSPSSPRPLTSCALSDGATTPLAAFDVSPDGQSILIVTGNTHQVVEWAIQDLIDSAEASDAELMPAPPSVVYQVPEEMNLRDGGDDDARSSRRQLRFHSSGSSFVLTGSAATTVGHSSLTVYSHGRSTPAMPPMNITSSVANVAWHPQELVLTVATGSNKLLTWKLSE